MSADPLLDKMDALLKKHRVVETTVAPQGALQSAPLVPPPLPDDAWLPVLTDVVAMGEVEQASSSLPIQPQVVLDQAAAPSIDPDALMVELEPRLSALIQNALNAEIRNSLDSALASLLAQLDVHVREIVRETLDEKMRKG